MRTNINFIFIKSALYKSITNTIKLQVSLYKKDITGGSYR
jgi:hypothetical protein